MFCVSIKELRKIDSSSSAHWKNDKMDISVGFYGHVNCAGFSGNKKNQLFFSFNRSVCDLFLTIKFKYCKTHTITSKRKKNRPLCTCRHSKKKNYSLVSCQSILCNPFDAFTISAFDHHQWYISCECSDDSLRDCLSLSNQVYFFVVAIIVVYGKGHLIHE